LNVNVFQECRHALHDSACSAEEDVQPVACGFLLFCALFGSLRSSLLASRVRLGSTFRIGLDRRSLKMDLQSLMDHSCHVESVVIVGLKRTKEYIVERELGNLKSAASLAEINDRLLEAHDNLTGLGIFDAVDITIDKGKKVTPRNNLRSSVR